MAMAINKVVYGTTVLVDLTSDTVTAAALQQGYTAHAKSGEKITGTLVPGITPTGAKTVGANGSYDVTSYATVVVALPEYDGSVSG